LTHVLSDDCNNLASLSVLLLFDFVVTGQIRDKSGIITLERRSRTDNGGQHSGCVH